MLAPLVALLQRPGSVVGPVELSRKSAEQLGHRKVGLAIAVVHRGIEHDRALRGEPGIAAPEIAVQQGWFCLVVSENFHRWSGDVDAVALRELDLRSDAPLDPELRPVFAPAVRLRRGADVVVAPPAEARAALAVRGCQHLTERSEVMT